MTVQELARRGVPNEHWNAALDAVFGEDGLRMRRYIDEQEAEERTAGWSPSPSPEAALLQTARARYQLTAGLPKEARRRRLISWLQRRGHAWDDLSRVVALIESETDREADS